MLDSFGALVSAVIAAVDGDLCDNQLLHHGVRRRRGAGLAGLSPDDGLVVLSAAALVAGALISGGTPLTALGGTEE
jgi:hypothetical protein